MDKQEIHLGELEVDEALLGGLLERACAQVRLPHLRGDEDLVALDAGGAQALADLALVVVHRGGIDVAVAEPQRLLDHARADAAAQVPGAEPDERNARAVCLNHLHGRAPLSPAPAARSDAGTARAAQSRA